MERGNEAADAKSETWTGKSNFGALQQKVAGLEDRYTDIREAIRGIWERQEEFHKSVLVASKPQWGAMAAIATVVVAVIGGISSMAIEPLKTDISDIKLSLKDMVPRDVDVEKWAEFDKAIIKIQSDIALLQKEKMDRSEVEGLKADMKSRIDELNSHLAQARKR